MKVNIKCDLDRFTADELDKIEHTREILAAVLSSDQFKAAVLGFNYSGTGGFYFRGSPGNWIDTPYTNEQIYAMIMAAVEVPGNANDGEADLYIVVRPGQDPDNAEVIGYGNPGEAEIYTWSVWFAKLSPTGYAWHLSHEWCHKLGFTHDEGNSPIMFYSVPYGICKIVADIAAVLGFPAALFVPGV